MFYLYEMMFLSLLILGTLVVASGNPESPSTQNLAPEDYPSLDLTAEGSENDFPIPDKEDPEGHGRVFGKLDLEKSNGRYGRKQKKNEKRKERQERREERRRNRQRVQSSGNFANQPILFPEEEERFRMESPVDSGNNLYGRNRAIKFPGFEELDSKEQFTNLNWLQRNITSIWHTLNHIQKGMKQLRRQFRTSNHNRGAKRHYNHDDEASKEEPCDPEWEIEPNACIDEHGLVCNGKGKCSCGQCACLSPFYGSHCQCSDLECNRYDGMLCGGAARGQCRCGACICRPEYTGDSCDCSVSTTDCQKSNGEICSGKGTCVCNRCNCDERYAGKYCDESIYSASICERLKPCVLCMAYGKKYPQCEECDIKVEMIDELESSRATCFMINLGCILKYSYVAPTSKGGTMTVLVKKDRSCLKNEE